MIAWDDLSDEEQLALNYCAPHGIPVSVFLGRVVGVGDPQWTNRDAQAAVLWQHQKDSRCQGCGQPRAECMAPEDDAPTYEVLMDRCWACQTRDAHQRQLSEEGVSSAGLYLGVTRKGD